MSATLHERGRETEAGPSFLPDPQMEPSVAPLVERRAICSDYLFAMNLLAWSDAIGEGCRMEFEEWMSE